MNITTKQYPFYIKSTVVLFGLMLLVFALFTLKGILAPIAFALIIAILLNPLVGKLHSMGIKRILAIAISLILAILIVGGILYFISSQIMHFGDNLPVLKQKFNEHLMHLQNWIAVKFNVPVAKQQKAITDALNGSKSFFGSALGGFLGTLGLIFLVPIYVFLILLYKKLIVNFFHEIFAE